MTCKSIVSKAAIVAMIVLDSDPVLRGILLESLLGSDSFIRGEVAHQENVAKTSKMVNEDGSNSIVLNDEFPFHLSNKADLGGLKLVH